MNPARLAAEPADEVVIVDGTLVPARDRQVAASSKNYRFSANLQVCQRTRQTVLIHFLWGGGGG